MASELPDWVRGERHDLARHIVDEARANRDALFQTMYVGQAALRIMRGAGQRGDAEAVLAALIADLEIEIQNCASDLLAAADLAHAGVRETHFRGRVAASILHRFNTLIAAGRQAVAIHQEDQDHEHGSP